MSPGGRGRTENAPEQGPLGGERETQGDHIRSVWFQNSGVALGVSDAEWSGHTRKAREDSPLNNSLRGVVQSTDALLRQGQRPSL